jgi:hypothetical protein
MNLSSIAFRKPPSEPTRGQGSAKEKEPKEPKQSVTSAKPVQSSANSAKMHQAHLLFTVNCNQVVVLPRAHPDLLATLQAGGYEMQGWLIGWVTEPSTVGPPSTVLTPEELLSLILTDPLLSHYSVLVLRTPVAVLLLPLLKK